MARRPLTALNTVFRKASSRSRVLPSFLVLGAQKAGTTWLYHMLAHHPQIFMPDCKEVHFWDKQYAKGYAWYEALFKEEGSEPAGELSLVARSASGSSSRQGGREGSALKRRGEITPAYAILPPETIAEIHARYPNLRLIYLVRNPIDRFIGAQLAEIRRHTALPIAVGFGISSPEQAAEVARNGDAVVVGSAIVRRIGEHGDAPDLAARIEAFVRPLAEATHAARP